MIGKECEIDDVLKVFGGEVISKEEVIGRLRKLEIGKSAGTYMELLVKWSRIEARQDLEIVQQSVWRGYSFEGLENCNNKPCIRIN